MLSLPALNSAYFIQQVVVHKHNVWPGQFNSGVTYNTLQVEVDSEMATAMTGLNYTLIPTQAQMIGMAVCTLLQLLQMVRDTSGITDR